MTGSYKILWLQAGSCGGCTTSFLGAEPSGPLARLEALDIELLWHPALSEETGSEAMRLLQDVVAGSVEFDCLVVEGSLLAGPEGSGRFHMLAGTGRPLIWWAAKLAEQARHVVAVGTCAAFGGFPAAGGNHTEARGLQFDGEQAGGLLGKGFRSGARLPVINVPGCAPHPDWMVETLQALSMDGVDETGLDSFGRPNAFFCHLAHHGCPRNEFYEFKASAELPSELGCLMENLGCKGTQALGDCNVRLWNGSGSCIRGGFACIACTAPGFEEPGTPFAATPKVAGIPVGLPVDMPKAWFVALAALSKSATPGRVSTNARSDHVVVPPNTPQPRRVGRKP